MKIAFLVHDFHRSGGHSRYVAELAQRFAGAHDVHLFANTFQPEPGVTFHYVPANRSNALALILTFRWNATRMLRTQRFEIIHDQGLCCANPNVVTAHISNRAWARARPSAPLKEKLFSAVIGAIEHLQYARSDRRQVIAVSERVRRDLQSDYGFNSQATVIHHGVDSRKFTPSHRGVSSTGPRYLFVGDFRKGVETAIRALESGELTCVGGTPPEPYGELAEQLDRGDRVHFHPATDCIEQFYARADVLLLPTPYDAFGMVVLEAMAAGLAVVVSENAGACELIRHGENGFILKNGAPLGPLMREAAASHVGDAARATALEHSWDRVANETMAVYERARNTPKLLAFATQGQGGSDEARLRTLLEQHPVEWFQFVSQNKTSTAITLARKLLRTRYPLAVMEGTGIAGGLPLLAARLFGQRYVVSSGDAVGPFVSQKSPLLGPLFGFYERLLYRCAAGFIGWSPYLAGRALTFGVPRAVTAAGWAPESFRQGSRAATRQRLGIPPEALVIGIVGSLAWTAQVRYCYGLELVRAAHLVKRPDLRFLIVGDGTGLAELNSFPDARILYTGQVSREELPGLLAAMDLASLPQSCNGIGSFRYSTKLSEYLAAGLPIVTGQIPAAYDLDDGWLFRLPGNAPWEQTYIEALARLLETLSPEQLAERRARVPVNPPTFNRDAQVARVSAFLTDILEML